MDKKIKNRNKGFAMALVLSVIVLLLLLGSSLLALSENARITSIRRSQEIAAKCAADAGLTKVLSDLNTAYLQGTLNLNDLPAEFVVTIENFGASFGYMVYQDAYGIIIDSIGTFGSAKRTVHCRAKVYSSRFEHTLFADNFEISNNAFIDGYDSNYGPYGGANIITTSIGTNSTNSNAIKLDNNGYINGDICVGPNGKPGKVIYKGKHFDVTGAMSAAQEKKDIPVINAPSLSKKYSKISGTITESGYYNGDLKTSNNETITINGNITLHIKGKVELDNGSQIEITEGSSLTLYIQDAVKMSNGGKINNLTQKPPNCKVFSTATSEVDYCFDNVGEFFGALYAPNAKVEIKNNAIIYGSIVGKELKIDNSAEIYGDRALLNGNYGDNDTKLVKGKWWE